MKLEISVYNMCIFFSWNIFCVNTLLDAHFSYQVPTFLEIISTCDIFSAGFTSFIFFFCV